MDVHQLLIAVRIDYKSVVLTFKSLTANQPAYLPELLQAHRPTRMLRSGEQINRLHAVGSRTAFAERAFCHAALAV
jgi:hypothetical protein